MKTDLFRKMSESLKLHYKVVTGFIGHITKRFHLKENNDYLRYLMKMNKIDPNKE